MFKLVNSITIGDHIINQPFLYEYENIHCKNNKIRLDHWTALENKMNFIEYIFIVFKELENLENLVNLDDLSIEVQGNGMDLCDRREHIYYNKIFPLECEN